MGETATHWIILHNGLSVSSGPATYVRIQCSSSIRLRSVPLRQRLALSGVIPAVLLPVWFQNVTCPMGALCLGAPHANCSGADGGSVDRMHFALENHNGSERRCSMYLHRRAGYLSVTNSRRSSSVHQFCNNRVECHNLSLHACLKRQTAAPSVTRSP